MSRETERILQAFFSTATQYYVTGRYALLAGLNPVAGNLLHHAIEMYLKGGLAKTMDLKQLKRFSHNLPDLWSTFKEQFADPALSRFDTLVLSLHRFEDLRYPDSILSRGMLVKTGADRPVPVDASHAPKRPEPEYELYLEDIDALVGKIFEVVSVDPAFVLIGLRPDACTYLRQWNTQPWAR